MKKIILKSILILGCCSNVLIADMGSIAPAFAKTYKKNTASRFSHTPPKPARAYVSTPPYFWLDNPTAWHEYYGYKIPGQRTCVSGCTKEYLNEIHDYNKRLKEGMEKALRKKRKK